MTRVAGNCNREQDQRVHRDGGSFNFRGQSGIKDTAGVRCDVQTGECTKGSAGRHEHGGYGCCFPALYHARARVQVRFCSTSGARLTQNRGARAQSLRHRLHVEGMVCAVEQGESTLTLQPEQSRRWPGWRRYRWQMQPQLRSRAAAAVSSIRSQAAAGKGASCNAGSVASRATTASGVSDRRIRAVP